MIASIVAIVSLLTAAAVGALAFIAGAWRSTFPSAPGS